MLARLKSSPSPNNAAIVAPSAGLDLAVRAIAFAAMGTAGQSCTTLRRLFVHNTVYGRLVPRLSQIYASVRVDDPREAATLVGPHIDRRAFESMQRALEEARKAGGIVHCGGAHRGYRGRARILCASRSLRDAGAGWSGITRNLCARFSTTLRFEV